MEPLLGGGEPPTLLALSREMQLARQDLTGALLAAAIARAYGVELDRTHAPCPQCTKLLARKRLDRKQLSTLLGPVELARPYFYCARCRHGFHPLDEALGVAAATHQYDVQAELTRLAADLPYVRAAEHFERLTQVEAGPHAGHDTLNAIAQQATLEVVVPEAAQIAARIDEAERRSGRWRPVLVVAADGASHACCRTHRCRYCGQMGNAPLPIHLHGLVTTGGVGPDGRWVATRPDFLIWGPILRDVFRQKLLAGLRRLLDQDSLYLPPTLAVAEVRARLAQLQHVPWHVRIEPPYASGKGLVVYLARYLHGGPLKNHRLVAFTGTAVCLRYRERRGRPHPKWRTLTLPVEEFLDRLFQHVPVPGLQMVRASGLYGRHQRAALQHCGLRLQPGWQEPPPAPAADQRCPRCGAALVVWSRARRARRARGLKNPWGPDRPSSACPTERWSRRRAVAYSHAP